MATFNGIRVSPEWKVVLDRAVKEGVRVDLNSGQRTEAEQADMVRRKGLWHPTRNPFGAAPVNPDAPHIKRGAPNHALDLDSISGSETQFERWVESKGVDWVNTVSTESWHGEVSLAGLQKLVRYSKDAAKRDRRAVIKKKIDQARKGVKKAQKRLRKAKAKVARLRKKKEKV